MWGTQPLLLGSDRGVRFIPTHVGNTRGPSIRLSVPPVHPHACGEHPARRGRRGLYFGSSPRMWGTLSISSLTEVEPRFIPTHVGNTPGQVWVHLQSPVHPHACGEHTKTRINISTCNGSSPRMWGTRLSRGLLLFRRRFIPTHVGNTGRG